MTETTIFVGLDVHKKTIAVATVEGRASADVRFHGTIANTPEAIRSLLRKLNRRFDLPKNLERLARFAVIVAPQPHREIAAVRQRKAAEIPG